MDTNNSVKKVVEIGLAEVPEIGWILASVVGIFWPESKEDVWNEIKDEVEKLVEKSMSDHIHQKAMESLTGLENVANDYSQAARAYSGDEPSKPDMLTKYDVTLAFFEKSMPNFQSKGYEVLLLPLFAPMVTMYLSLLRDGVVHGKDWGLNPKRVDQEQGKMKKLIAEAVPWVNKWYAVEQENLSKKENRFNTDKLSEYTRWMTRNVTDPTLLWPHFDPTNPLPEISPVDTEVYSNLEGELANAYFYVSRPRHDRRCRLSTLRLSGSLSKHHIHGEITTLTNSYQSWGPRAEDPVAKKGSMGRRDYWIPTYFGGRPPDWQYLRMAIMPDNPIVAYSSSGHYLECRNGLRLPFTAAKGNVAAKTKDVGPLPGQILSRIQSVSVSSMGLALSDYVMTGFTLGWRYEDSYPDPSPVLPVEFVNWSDSPARSGIPEHSLDHAIDAAASKNQRLLWPHEIWTAWKRAKLHVFAFGMMADGEFCVPIQEANGNVKAGANLRLKGGNQGFFMTPYQKVFFEPYDGVTFEKAMEKCSEKQWRMASPYEVQAAWENRALDIDNWGILWDGTFAHPSQKHASEGLQGPKFHASEADDTRGLESPHVPKPEGFFRI